MEIIHFREITGRDREEDLETNRHQRRTFQAITDTAEGGPDQILADLLVPRVGDVLDYIDESTGVPAEIIDETLVVVRRRAEQTDADNLCNWTITVEYMGTDEPETWPAEVEFSPTRYQEHVIDDRSDPPKPVVNSAQDPFTEGLVRDRTRFTITITKNIVDGDWDPVQALEFQDTLNQDPFLAGYFPTRPDGFPAGTCKLTMGAKRTRKKGFNEFYWAHTATIDVDLNGWEAKVRDAGFQFIDAATLKKGKITDVYTGGTANSPQLLDGLGGILPLDGPPQSITFTLYVSKDWAPLHLEY